MREDDTTRKQLEEAKALHIGGPPMDSTATLCIYGDDLDPDFVSETLKCQPTHAHRKGERDPGRPKIRPARIGGWFLEAPEMLSFIDKITFLLDSTVGDEGPWRTLAVSHVTELRAAIFLRSWTEGFDLTNATLFRIAQRGWSFGLSMYSAEGEEILDAFLGRSPAPTKQQ